jgi:hypothetical protein
MTMRVIWKEPNSRTMILHINQTLTAIQEWIGDPQYLDRNGSLVFLGNACADQNGEDFNGFKSANLKNIRGRILIVGYPEGTDFEDIADAVPLMESLTDEDVALWR